MNPANIYLCKVNNRNTRKRWLYRCLVSLLLPVKKFSTFLVLVLLTLSMCLFAGKFDLGLIMITKDPLIVFWIIKRIDNTSSVDNTLITLDFSLDYLRDYAVMTSFWFLYCLLFRLRKYRLASTSQARKVDDFGLFGQN